MTSMNRKFMMICFSFFIGILIGAPLCLWAENDEAKITAGQASVKATAEADADIAAVKQEIATDSGNAKSRAKLGYLFLRRGALDDALAAFNEALRLNPRSTDAKAGKGIILARRDNLKEAEQELKDALILNPDPVKAHYGMGIVFEKQGKYGQALAEFKEGIRKYQQGRK